MKNNFVLDGLFGLCTGDALGVPFEFDSRDKFDNDPVMDMVGFGSHHQPAGTWSDDSSLTFCLAESLCYGFDLEDIGNRFCRWYDEGYWAARDGLFDIGVTTEQAINLLKNGVSPVDAGGREEFMNGNGSLMRILPMAFFAKDFDVGRRFDLTHQVSCITHGHLRSQMSCGMYVEFVVNLLHGFNAVDAYSSMNETVLDVYSVEPFCSELGHFDRILQDDISLLDRHKIKSGGYVIHTLEASLWSFLNSDSYKKAVLTAVNLGHDTDTTGAVTGGLAGVYYGFEDIPVSWREKIARKDDVIDLSERLKKLIQNDY